MSSCKCDEISSCNTKIQFLSNAKKRLNGCVKKAGVVADGLNIVAGYSEQAYTSNKSSDVVDAIKDLDTDMYTARLNFQSKLLTMQTQLLSELSDLKEEDNQYHQEQKKKEKVADSQCVLGKEGDTCGRYIRF